MFGSTLLRIDKWPSHSNKHNDPLCSFCNKADRSMRKMPNVKIRRIRSDIKNLNLGAIPELSSMTAKWVGCGKHLCGAATDYAIRACVTKLKEERESASGLGEAMDGQAGLQGLAIATCCHHRCTWESFVGKDFFKKQSFSSCEFELVSWMTGILKMIDTQIVGLLYRFPDA